MSPLRSPHAGSCDADPPRPTLRQRSADLAHSLARALRRSTPAEAEAAVPAPAPLLTPHERMAASAREAAADALADRRVSPALRAAIEAHRDATVAMLLDPDDSDAVDDPLCEAVEASGAALRGVPARSIADVRAKLAVLLLEILPDVISVSAAAFIENAFDDVERLAAVDAPLHDLSACTLPQLARLYETWEAVFRHLTTAGASPCFADDGAGGYTPAGDVLDREYDRAGGFLEDIAAEARRRQPDDEQDRRERFGVLARHELNANGHIADRALRADFATAWGR